jgi:hypothetical protein
MSGVLESRNEPWWQAQLLLLPSLMLFAAVLLQMHSGSFRQASSSQQKASQASVDSATATAAN